MVIHRKQSLYVAETWDIFIKAIPMCSPLSLQSKKPSSISLESWILKLTYLIMLFILQLMHTASPACGLGFNSLGLCVNFKHSLVVNFTIVQGSVASLLPPLIITSIYWSPYMRWSMCGEMIVLGRWCRRSEVRLLRSALLALTNNSAWRDKYTFSFLDEFWGADTA